MVGHCICYPVSTGQRNPISMEYILQTYPWFFHCLNQRFRASNLDFWLKFFWDGGQHFSQLIQCDTQPPCRPPVRDWPSGKSHHSWREAGSRNGRSRIEWDVDIECRLVIRGISLISYISIGYMRQTDEGPNILVPPCGSEFGVQRFHS